ncbi:hypothetical protein PR048_007147 [Dryococelus australis]|uniref:Uncharacterized protein n=1 Tax=Dryococelus australis TaxID=614101 RepID=A0ABQ9ICV7_9NEOP|nr:hypothetical protein PR048_007147 [Dryococelus australis]
MQQLIGRCPKKWEETQLAGIEWLKGCMKRHITRSLRKPENTHLSGVTSFNKENVAAFQENYRKVGQAVSAERGICKEAFNMSVSRKNISGFENAGIWLFSTSVFGDEDFECSAVTDRPVNTPQITDTASGTHELTANIPGPSTNYMFVNCRKQSRGRQEEPVGGSEGNQEF